MMTAAEISKALAQPFPLSELKFFPIAISEANETGKVGAYADARAYMDHLDSVVGADGWGTTYRLLDSEAKAVECTLSVRYCDVWVAKADIGYPNGARDPYDAEKEPLKAAYSDALKRACVQHGVGRFLYSVELVKDWLPVEKIGRSWRFKEQPRLKGQASASEQRQQSSPITETAPSAAPDEAAPVSVDQLGVFKKDGGLDASRFHAFVIAQGLKSSDIALVTGTVEDGRPDLTGWLQKNPNEDLLSLIKRTKEMKARATATDGAGQVHQVTNELKSYPRRLSVPAA